MFVPMARPMPLAAAEFNIDLNTEGVLSRE
jgi:hypothetical protein